MFNRNCWSCNICQKKKKIFKWSPIWHPKPQKIYTSILLATATHLKRQEQNHLFISWMCCENKFLQVTFDQEKEKVFSTSQSKFVTHVQEHSPILTPSKPSGTPSQKHLLHSSYFPQALTQCPIKRTLHRSADVAALVQWSSLFCRAAVDAQPLYHSLQPPHTVRGSLDYDCLMVSAKAGWEGRRQSISTGHHNPHSQVTSPPAQGSLLLSALPQKCPICVTWVMGWAAASPPSPELERGYTTKAQEEPRVPQSTSEWSGYFSQLMSNSIPSDIKFQWQHHSSKLKAESWKVIAGQN